MPDRSSYGPCGGITKWTNGIAFDLALNIPKQVNIAHPSFSVFNIVQDLFHPSCSFPAWRTLSTTFVAIESCQRECVANHALVLVEYDESARAHHGTGLKTAVSKAFIGHHPLLTFRCFQQQVSRQYGH